MINNINIIALSIVLIFYVIGLIVTCVLLKLKSSREVYRNFIKEIIESDESVITYLKSLSIRILSGIIIIFILLLFNLNK